VAEATEVLTWPSDVAPEQPPESAMVYRSSQESDNGSREARKCALQRVEMMANIRAAQQAQAEAARLQADQPACALVRNPCARVQPVRWGAGAPEHEEPKAIARWGLGPTWRESDKMLSMKPAGVTPAAVGERVDVPHRKKQVLTGEGPAMNPWHAAYDKRRMAELKETAVDAPPEAAKGVTHDEKPAAAAAVVPPAAALAAPAVTRAAAGAPAAAVPAVAAAAAAIAPAAPAAPAAAAAVRHLAVASAPAVRRLAAAPALGDLAAELGMPVPLALRRRRAALAPHNSTAAEDVSATDDAAKQLQQYGVALHASKLLSEFNQWQQQLPETTGVLLACAQCATT
jgi:hypothetical protein